jgi:hypothetical protein
VPGRDPPEHLIVFGRGQGPAQAANPHPKRDRLWTNNPHPRPHLGPLARFSVRPSRQQAGADGAHVRTCDAAPSAHRASASSRSPAVITLRRWWKSTASRPTRACRTGPRLRPRGRAGYAGSRPV